MEKETDKEDWDREETNVTSSEYLLIFVFNFTLQDCATMLFISFHLEGTTITLSMSEGAL